ncbi:hypothetical protein RYX36_002970 [Vicia faba]
MGSRKIRKLQSCDIELALRIFGEMRESNLVSRNTMTGVMVLAEMFEEAISLFREMQNQGIKGDNVTMVGIASACGYLGTLDLAKWIYAYIEKNDIHIDMQLGTALVDMFSRCGDPLNAIHVFGNMKNTIAWTAAIRIMEVDGNAKGAI